MAAFKYKPRSADKMEKRENYKGDFQGFVQDAIVTYQPKKGDNTVRILPPTFSDDPDHYGIDVYVHYRVGPNKASVLCPSKMKSKPCPICEARAKAERAGDEDLAKELAATRRVLVYMIDRLEEKKGVQAWAMPQSLDADLVKISKDKATGEYYMIDDPHAGYDISFDKTGDQQMTKYTGLQLARRASSVNEEYLEFISELPLTDILVWRTYDEIAALFGGEHEAEPERPAPSRRPIERARLPRDDDNLEREREAIDERTRDPEPSRRARRDDDEPPVEREPVRERQRDPEPKPEPASGASRAAALKARFNKQ